MKFPKKGLQPLLMKFISNLYCFLVRKYLVFISKHLDFDIIFITAHSFGDSLFQGAYLIGNQANQKFQVVVPLIKSRHKVKVQQNRYIFHLLSISQRDNMKILKNKFISSLITRIYSGINRQTWERMYPYIRITHFIEFYGRCTPANFGIKRGISSLIENQNANLRLEVLSKLGIDYNERVLVIGSRLRNWQTKDNQKPSSIYRSSQSGRFEKIANEAISLGYRVVTVGDPIFHIESQSSEITNYASSKKRKPMLDVTIPAVADVIIGNLFGALDMRMLNKKHVPFMSIDSPLPSLFFNEQVNVSVPTKVFFKNGNVVPFADLLSYANWNGIGWADESADILEHEYFCDDCLLSDFKHFMSSIDRATSEMDKQVENRIFRYLPKSYANTEIHFAKNFGRLSPSFLKFIDDNKDEIWS